MCGSISQLFVWLVLLLAADQINLSSCVRNQTVPSQAFHMSGSVILLCLPVDFKSQPIPERRNCVLKRRLVNSSRSRDKINRSVYEQVESLTTYLIHVLLSIRLLGFDSTDLRCPRDTT